MIGQRGVALYHGPRRRRLWGRGRGWGLGGWRCGFGLGYARQQECVFALDLGPFGHGHAVEMAAALEVGVEHNLPPVGRKGGIHNAAEAAGQAEFAALVEVIDEEIVDLVAGGDEEQLVAFGQPLRPQIVGGAGYGCVRCVLG